MRLSESVLAGVTGLLDASVIIGSGLLVFAIYAFPGEPERFGAYIGATMFMALLSLQGFAATGRYTFNNIIHATVQLRRVVLVLIGAFLVLLSCAFALKVSDTFSRVWAFSWLLAMLFLVPVSRMTLALGLRRLARKGMLGRNIVVYGGGAHGAALIRHIQSIDEPWNRIVAVFDDRATRNETGLMGFPLKGDLHDLLSWSRDHRADEILVALPWGADQRLRAITHVLSVLPADVRLSPEFIGFDFLHRRVSHQYGVPMLSVLDKPVSGWSAIVKRTMDIVLGSFFLVLASPLLAVIGILIKLDSPGSVLFLQKRCGFNNQLFYMYKFRTMYTDQCDADAKRLTERNDPRVTRVGAILRRFSLDELPQLFNVLSGEMSVVGPRPHALQAMAGERLYEDVVDQYAVRHKVKPGITGWAQVKGWRGNTKTEADLIGRLEHDLFYIEKWSVSFDLAIILRTVGVVLKGDNSY